jgi:hypothetical protein
MDPSSIASADPSALPSEGPSKVASGEECQGCRKDFSAGNYIDCGGVLAVGTAGCEFGANKSVPLQACGNCCRVETGCTHFSHSSAGNICRLHLVDICERVENSVMDLYELIVVSVP